MTNSVFTPKTQVYYSKKSYTYDTLVIHLNIHLNTKKAAAMCLVDILQP